MALSFIAGVFIIFALYYIVRSRLSRKRFLLLIGLRIIIVAILLWLITDPLITYYKTKLKSRKIFFLVDNSQSMSIKDEGYRHLSRIEAVNSFFCDDNSRLKSLAEKNVLYQVYNIGDTCKIAQDVPFRADGLQSNLLTNISLFFEMLKDNPAGIYLLSDGCSTQSRKPSEISYPYPVNTVAIGNPADQVDIMIESVDVPVSVDLEDDIVFNVKVGEKKVPEGTKISLKIFDEQNNAVLEKQILSPVRGIQSLAVKPDSPGLRIYTLTVDAQSVAEPYSANNKYKIAVLVKKDEINILAAGIPSWDMAFVVRSLRSIKNVNLSVYNLIGKEKKFFSLQSNSLHTAGEVLKNISNQDVIVLFDFPLSLFTEDQIESIRRSVEYKGTGMFFLGGKNSFGSGNYHNTALNDMLPFRLVNDDFSSQQFEVKSNRNIRVHPLVTGFFDKIDFNRLPPLDAVNVVNSVKPLADLFLVAQSLIGEMRIPLFAIMSYGKGKVAAFAGKGLYRWSMQATSNSGELITDNILDLFVKKSVSWIASLTDEAFVHVMMPKINYSLGEKINVEVVVLDRTYQPAEKAQVKGKVICPDKKEILLEFIPVSDTASRFSSSFLPALSGKYTLEIEGIGNDGDHSISKSSFFVYQPTDEFKKLNANYAFLKKTADLSGGKFYSYSEFKNHIKNIKIKKDKEKIAVTRLVIDYPFILLIILFLCVAEWILRIKQGLN